jgi:hypothetical protein
MSQKPRTEDELTAFEANPPPRGAETKHIVDWYAGAWVCEICGAVFELKDKLHPVREIWPKKK